MRWTIGVMALAGLLLGCDAEPQGEDDGGGGGDGTETQSATTDASGTIPGVAILLVDIDAQAPCNVAGVTGVQITTQRIGCESLPPAPCTLPTNPPTIEGDILTCPTSDARRLLGVEVDTAGRYNVQTVVEFTTGETEVRCHAIDGDPEILVPEAQLEPGVAITLDTEEVACD